MLVIRPIPKNSWLAGTLVPFLYFLSVVLVDHYWVSGPTVVPAFAMLGLMAVSFFIPLRWMVFYALLCSVLVIGGFFNESLYTYFNHASLHDGSLQFSSYARAFTFPIAAGFCCLFSFSLRQLRRAHRESYEIVSKYPKPLITTNENGWILYANDAAKARYNIADVSIANSFFELFAPYQAYKLMDQYFRLFGTEGSGAPAGQELVSLELEFGGKRIIAKTVMLDGAGSKKLLILPEE
jgi:PAS domain-containing protein